MAAISSVPHCNAGRPVNRVGSYVRSYKIQIAERERYSLSAVGFVSLSYGVRQIIWPRCVMRAYCVLRTVLVHLS